MASNGCCSQKTFHGKVVIVTGSSNGIGRGIAVEFASQGAQVVITGRDEQALQVTRSECVAAGAFEQDVLEFQGDITTMETATQIINGAMGRFGRIDVLVNNAGTVLPDSEGRAGCDQPLRLFDDTINVNVRQVLQISQMAVPHLEAVDGCIVNIGSVSAGPYANVTSAYYAVSKAAVDALTINMAENWIRRGIRVNIIHPGVVQSAIGIKLLNSEELAGKMYDAFSTDRQCIPLRRVGRPEDIAKMAVFLADPEKSSFFVGSRITIDGGSALVNPLLSKTIQL